MESSEILQYDAFIKFIWYYIGGKIENKYYKIITYENIKLNETDLIVNDTFLRVNFPKKNNKKVGVDLYTAFSNNLTKDFLVYLDNIYELDENVDETIKLKAQEIINDPNSKYKDYPDYYKIGKFIYSYM